jgi:hypothetical protein
LRIVKAAAARADATRMDRKRQDLLVLLMLLVYALPHDVSVAGAVTAPA